MQRPQGLGAWIPAPAYLPKTPGWAGCQGGSPGIDGFLPLPFLTLTLVPVWGGESASPRPLPSMCPARERARVQGGTTRSGPLEHPAQVFIL